MPEFHVGQLVLDPDGYYAIVLAVGPDALELFLSNGLRITAMPAQVEPLGLRPGKRPDPPASFAEIIDREFRPA
jgi:hypothetical protein